MKTQPQTQTTYEERVWDGEKSSFHVGGFRHKDGYWIKVGDTIYTDLGRPLVIVVLVCVMGADTEHPIIWATIRPHPDKGLGRRVLFDLDSTSNDPLFYRTDNGIN